MTDTTNSNQGDNSEWLKEAQARCDATTPGPWVSVTGDDEYCTPIWGVISDAELERVKAGRGKHRGDFPEDTRWILVEPGVAPVRMADEVNENEDFFIAARTDLPRALHLIGELQARIAELEEQKGILAEELGRQMGRDMLARLDKHAE